MEKKQFCKAGACLFLTLDVYSVDLCVCISHCTQSIETGSFKP